ncbi:MAG: hypothetical protein K6E36_11390 [Oscillospiraceae bacterium]|nr:hypothetical protein [Oscillospiraceae bacterium]
MIYYRFDIPKRQLHYRTEQSKEYIISFIVMYELICMLAANKAVFEELCRLSEKCYRSKKNQPVFHAYVKEYPVQKRYKRAWRFLTDAFYDFSAYHNHHFCRTLWLCFVRKYMSRNLHPQYRQMGKALHLYASGTRKEQIGKYPLYCTELDGKLYHSVEPQYLLCCSFLIEFMEAIYAAGLHINKCKVCGTLFCSTSEETCCSDRTCKKLFSDLSEDSLLDEIGRIKKRFDDKINHDRKNIRDLNYPQEAVDEFDAFTKPLQKRVTDQNKALRRNEPTLQDVREFEKKVSALHTPINEMKAGIIAKYAPIRASK